MRRWKTSGLGGLRRTSAWPSCRAAVLAFTLLFAGLAGPAMATPAIANTKSIAGNINYVVTGGSLRTQPNSIDPCAIQSSGSASITGVPAGATIRAAYLYFVGDGDTPDYDISFNGFPLSADTQYSDTLNFLGEDYNYFGGVVDVTPYVGGNGTYSFGGLAVQVTDNPGGAQYCTNQGVIAGWSLVVVYEKASEPLRVINIFDGLQHFYGSDITLNPGNFKIPSSGIDGKMTVISWGGDDDINTTLNGLGEDLEFNGHSLNDGYSPANNQYNSTINTLPSTSAWGVDIDTYDVGSYLSAGQTSATTLYSTGADDVYLTAQIISVTNEPVADLSVDSAHAGTWAAGGTGNYALTVNNNGPQPATGTTTVTDTIPAGLTYVSASGTNWTCGYSAPVVTCTTTSSIASGSSLPAITVGVAIDAGAGTSVDNVATVSNAIFDNVAGNNSDSDTTAILHSNLSTSTKDVADQDGGDAEPGDTLRYTITLVESSGVAATAASVVDVIPAHLAFAGSIDAASTCTGDTSGTSATQVSMTGIAVAANGSCTLVFDTTIVGGTEVGIQIENTATITLADPHATGAAPVASVTVSQSQVAANGNKLLYLDDTPALSRTPQSGGTQAATSIARNASASWTMGTSLAGPLTIKADSTVSADILVNCVSVQGGACRNGGNLFFTAELWDDTTNTQIGSTSANASFNTVAYAVATANIAIGSSDVVIPAGHELRLTIRNTSSSNRSMRVQPFDGTTGSVVGMQVVGSISADSLELYTVPYSGTSQKSSYVQNDVVYVRGVASDAFGGSDVGSAKLTITDANGVVQLNGAAMGAAVATTATSATFEKQYSIPGDAAVGNWTASITAYEGEEATVSQTRNKSFLVGLPVLSVAKSHAGDFTAGASGTYTLVVTNNSLSTVAGTTTVTDTLPAGLAYVGASGTGWTCGAAGQVVTCTNGSGVAASTSMPAITLVVAVAGSAGASVANQAQVANPSVNGGAAQAGNTDNATVLHPDLSGAGTVKEVADLNGGDAAPGDTLRYTITIAESAGVAAGGVSVTDDIPANVSGFTMVSTPPGSTDNSSGGGGANGTGYLDVTGISVPASGSVAIVFDVTIADVDAGAKIDNTATIVNPNGPGANPVAPLVTVLQSQLAASGDKTLYVYANQTMSRVRQTGSASFTVPENSSRDFTLASTIKPLVLTAGGTVTVSLVTSATGGSNANRQVEVQLLKNGTTPIGTLNGTTPDFNSTTPTLRNFTFVVAGGGVGSLSTTDTLVLRVYNQSSGGGTRNIAIEQFDGTSRSTVDVPTATVINVDSAGIFDAAYPAITNSARYLPGGVVYVRAVVSDPFGSFDVNHATVTITNPAGTVKVNAAAMNQVAEDTGNATRTFEYTYTLPSNARLGSWTASVKGYEGVENLITHTGNTSFNVEGTITLGKTWGATANAGDTVTLSISGGTSATAGISTAPSTLTQATATSGPGAIITLAEAYTVGVAGDYTTTLACSKVTDSSTVVVSGTALSRTITMPADSSVTCTWDNSKSVRLTVVKLSTVVSDPVDGTSNPKAIPGAVVEYSMIVTNPAANPLDADSLFLRDPLPSQVKMRVADLGDAGSGPVSFTNGSPPSGMTYTFAALGNLTDDLQFSNDSGATWNYVPTPDADGYDAAVTGLRVNPKGAFSSGGAQFTLRFRVMVK